MAIDRDEFAEECVHQGLRFGIHPHYLVGVAQLRSGISDTNVGNRIGPYRLTQTEWNANCSDEDFDITDFEADDVNTPEFQCCIYALMALRAQNRCLDRLGQLPSALDLYLEQWPNPPVASADLQAALLANGLDTDGELFDLERFDGGREPVHRRPLLRRAVRTEPG